MIQPRKRTPKEKTEILKRLSKSRKYGFALVGEKIPDIPLGDLVPHLEGYYQEQRKKGEYRGLKHKEPDLANYCCLFTRKLRGLSEGDAGYMDQTDVEYAAKTVLALDELVEKRISSIEELISNEAEDKYLEPLCREAGGYVRAMSTLASNDFEPWTRDNRNRKLKEAAEQVIAQYREAGAIKKD